MIRRAHRPEEARITALIGLGSNLGDRQANLKRAVREIERSEGSKVIAVSSFYESEPVGREDQPDFVNAAAEVWTTLSPRSLLGILRGIELRMGRRRLERWGPRNVDLDILLFGDYVLSEADLTIPHPRMHQRRFVLAPLCEIAPDALHPVLGMRIRDLLARLDEGRAATRLAAFHREVWAL